MFGKILSIRENTVFIENLTKIIQSKVIGLHLVFEHGEEKLVGEIKESTPESFEVVLVGEIVNNIFTSGTVKKPFIDANVRLIYKEEVALILGPQTYTEGKGLYMGKSLSYQGYNVAADLNTMFTNHFAIMGNTGSGKSCSVSRIIQNIFIQNPNRVPKNANIILFDVYGEYHTAFTGLDKLNGINYKSLTTKTEKFSDVDLINIPAYFLEIDDLALLLNVDDQAQLPILEKTLNLVYIFASEGEQVVKFKNDIISKALLDILSSGKNAAQIRDQIIAVLTTYNTEDINLESEIVQPGYVRSLKQCLNIDNTGKLNTVHLVIEFLEQYNKDNLDYKRPDKPIVYTLKDLAYALEFALISEGTLNNSSAHEKTNILKVRLNSIINSEASKYFEVGEYIDKISYVRKLFSKNAEKAQIVNINMNYIEERFAKAMTKIYSKLFLDFALRVENRGSFPITIILEEAHRYVQNDNDINIIGYNIYDRITKEGRKYGVTLGLITQRPSELSNTSLSQCSNFITFRMYHPADLALIRSITSHLSDNTIETLKTLHPGVCLAFGNAFKLPTLMRVDYPNPAPSSTNPDLNKTWYE